MESIWDIVLQSGIFACLFVWLLFYQIKDSSSREKKYIEIIDKLSVELDVVKDVKDDVSEIK
ncbi:MAG: UviB-like protein, partial [Clostridia bacterium]|nr:UviB-like protein [Clostridia bacterium]